MESIPKAYVALRAGTSNRDVVPVPQAGNRFLGSLKVYKFGLKEEMKGRFLLSKLTSLEPWPTPFNTWFLLSFRNQFFSPLPRPKISAL
jgi:hypothetical protein